MKTLLLIITVWYPDVSYVGGIPMKKVLVSSPEAASVIYWQDTNPPRMNQRNEAHLYEIDVEKGTCIEIPLPLVTFQKIYQFDLSGTQAKQNP